MNDTKYDDAPQDDFKHFILFFSSCNILGGTHIFIRNTKFCQMSLTFCFDSIGVPSVDVAISIRR